MRSATGAIRPRTPRASHSAIMTELGPHDAALLDIGTRSHGSAADLGRAYPAPIGKHKRVLSWGWML